MKKNRKIALAALAVAVGTVLIATQAAWSGRDGEPPRLEGAWIAKVVGMPLQWTYVLSPSDPAAKSAAISGSIQVHVPPAVVAPGLFADLEYNSPIVGEIVMTGPDTTKFTAVWYGMKKGYPFNQIVYIGVNSGWGKFTGPGKSEGTHHLAFYYPSADGDGDGLPDPGAVPALCLPAAGTIDTRVPMLPPCTPAP
jgi:hypothetical protein